MIEKDLDYLKQYHHDVELISNDCVYLCNIPPLWKHILSQSTTNQKIIKTISAWKKYVAEELRNTISYLQENLEDICLIRYGENYSLLYAIRASDGQIQYYEGGNPNNLTFPSRLQMEWNKFPASVTRFFHNLHNGFFYYASGSMGLLSVSDVVIFEEEDWGILEELSQPLQIQIQTTFGIFASGMGGYVAIDSSNCENCNATLWFTKKQPRYGINFWHFVDEWIVIGMQN